MELESSMLGYIDINFDFRTDAPPGKDPDTFSPTLRSFHKLLWSKPLPSSVSFNLDTAKDGAYLHHQSQLGEFFLTSDTATPTFSRWASMAHIINQVDSDDLGIFRRLVYTMGSMLIFPGNRIDGKSTINGAKGFHPLIKDRLDLTLECIRRHYNGKESPLSGVLVRYQDFFALFQNFQGYVEFFLLQDLVSDDFSSIKFLMPFENFKTPAAPKTLDGYLTYKDLTIKYINARNQRILKTA